MIFAVVNESNTPSDHRDLQPDHIFNDITGVAKAPRAFLRLQNCFSRSDALIVLKEETDDNVTAIESFVMTVARETAIPCALVWNNPKYVIVNPIVHPLELPPPLGELVDVIESSVSDAIHELCDLCPGDWEM